MFKSENMAYMRFVLSKLTNKYILTIVIFFIWMIFFDRSDWRSMHKLSHTIEELEEEKSFYTQEYEKLDSELTEIIADREKYARERFYLHRSDEIVYLIK